MKKCISIFLILTLILGLAACGQKAPGAKDKVEEFCAAVKAFDFETMQGCVETDIDPDSVFGQDLEGGEAFMAFLKENAAKISYNILETAENGDTATSRVSLEYEDVSEVVKETFLTVFQMMFSGDLSFDASEEAQAEAITAALEEKVSDIQPTRSTAELSFDLTKGENGWKIKEVPEEFVTVLTGNMKVGVEAAGEELSAMFADMFGGDDFEGSGEVVYYPISNEVLFDNEYASMTIVDGGIDEWGDFFCTVQCENKTEDRSLEFYVDDVEANGWLVPSYFHETVEAGKSLSSTFNLYQSNLAVMGLESVDRLSLELKLYDTEDVWMEELFYDGWTTVYPTGLTDDEIVVPQRPAGSSEFVMVDNEDYSYVILGPVESSWDYEIAIYIQNKSDLDLNFGWDQLDVNGVPTNFGAGTIVPAGKQTITTFGFDFADIEDAEIESVEEMAITLRVFEADNWDDDPFLVETYTYRP